MKKEFAEHIAKLPLTTYHYKILLLLDIKAYNQAELARILSNRVQYIHRCIKEIKEYNLIVEDRVEGRNIFYKLQPDLKKLQELLPGQQEINMPGEKEDQENG